MAEKTYDFPWDPTSRSYNIAKRIIEEVQKGEKGSIPKDRSSQKEYFVSLAKDCGVTRHTIANIMHVLKSTKRIPFGTLGSTIPSSREDPSSPGKDTKAPFVPSGVPPESTASTVPETKVLSKVPEGGSEVPPGRKEDENPPSEGSKVPDRVPRVPPESTASIVLPPEVVEALKKISVLDNLPELMRQSAREYVQSIGGPAATNPEDIEMQANLKIEEGSAVARMVYLTPKTLLYYDFSRGRGFKGILSEFLNNFADSWFKRQDIKVGVIEKLL